MEEPIEDFNPNVIEHVEFAFSMVGKEFDLYEGHDGELGYVDPDKVTRLNLNHPFVNAAHFGGNPLMLATVVSILDASTIEEISERLADFALKSHYAGF